MNWMESVNHVLKYIEAHLMEEMTADELARVALSSKYHFFRQFHIITGISLKDYIRQRRLSLAGRDVVQSDDKIIDIAYRYGYETPEAFSKAFKRLHGMSPMAARKAGAVLKAVPPISFEIRVKGEKSMDYRIEKREGFKIIGVSKKVSTKDNQNFVEIPKMWTQANENGMTDKMYPHIGDLGILGVCHSMNMESEEFEYMIGIEGDQLEEVTGTVVLDVKPQTWAVFESIGPMPHAIQKVWQRIFSEWFPATGYEHADAPELEAYLPGDPSASDYKCEIWIPIVEK